VLVQHGTIIGREESSAERLAFPETKREKHAIVVEDGGFARFARRERRFQLETSRLDD